MPANPILLTIQVVFDESAPSFHAAKLYASVEDVSRADTASVSLGSLVMGDISHTAGETHGPELTLPVSVPDPGAYLAVRVHIDLDGDGRYSRGDFISMESYPVLTRGHPSRVTVRVRQI
jgi:hypothetical protein